MQRRGKEKGLALIYAVVVAFVAASLCALVLDYSTSDYQLTKVKRYQTQARYLAEGALEFAKKDVQRSIANFIPEATFAPGPAQPFNIQINGLPVFYTITPTGFNNLTTDPSGIATISNHYEIAATAVVQGIQSVARKIISADATPIFQFAVFYTGDLEILPGPNMTIKGRVHTNADMYLGANNSLWFDTNYVRSVGNIYRNRKDSPSLSQGNVYIRKYVDNPFNSAEPLQYHQLNNTGQMTAATGQNVGPYDSNFAGFDANGDGDFVDANDFLPWALGAEQYWAPPTGYPGYLGHTVHTSAHGTTEAVTPDVGSIAMFEPAQQGGDYSLDPITNEYVPVAPGAGTHNKGFYHENAGLTITMKVDSTGNPTGALDVIDGNGFLVNPSLYNSFITIGQVYDRRQDSNGTGTKVDIIDIDIGKLISTNPSLYPTNGLIYAAGYGNGTGTQAKGIRLKGGAELLRNTTVVSEGQVYVQGDFNTVNKKGAAVIADAVNLLSNSWNDTKGPGNLPTAAATTYNVAFISGNTSTVPNISYNGGLENLPRFHENWSGKNCNITGSFVNTWESVHANSPWSIGGSYYNPPNRIWNYETAFNNINNLPPFTPLAVSARDIVTW